MKHLFATVFLIMGMSGIAFANDAETILQRMSDDIGKSMYDNLTRRPAIEGWSNNPRSVVLTVEEGILVEDPTEMAFSWRFENDACVWVRCGGTFDRQFWQDILAAATAAYGKPQKSEIVGGVQVLWKNLRGTDLKLTGWQDGAEFYLILERPNPNYEED